MRTFVIAAAAGCQLALSGCAAVMTAAASHPAAVAAIIEFAPFALVVGAVGAVGIAGIAGSQPETHEAGTLGAFLQDKQATVGSIVQGAMQDGREVVVVAGLQVQRSIARARIAYRTSLALKDDALGVSERTYRTELESAITGLGRKENQAIKEAGDQAQSIADKLRVPGEAPQVRSFGPVFLFSFLPFQSITIRGTFPPGYPGGGVPQLAVNGKHYKAYTYDAQSLAFSVPTIDLIDGESRAIVWRRAELEIPWDKPLFDAFTRAGYENFVVLGLLPDSPGRATIEHRVANKVESESFDMAWGSRRVFNHSEGSWKLRYSKFGGNPVEFERTDLSSPLVRVRSDARSVTISAYPF